MVLDVGGPIRILDVARQLVAKSKTSVDIVFTGLRQGEKMHEVLFGASEHGEYKRHPLICHVPVEPLEPRLLEKGAASLVDLSRLNEGIRSGEPSRAA